LIDHYLNKTYIERQGIFNAAEIDKLVTKFRSGEYYHSKRVWSLVIFQLWFEQFMLLKPK
ncbi:MAG TPA: hypothetical protein VK796_09330, partial [Cytophaga sp.]|nr:hypothetical protein [Cytophaga sp.]